MIQRDPKTIEAQLERFRTGFPWMNIVAPATPQRGIRVLDEAVIRQYIGLVKTTDKAGAYAIQEHGEMLIERIGGLRSNIVGLPVEEVAAALAESPFRERLP